MKFGLHLSIAGGIEKVPQRAYDSGCECFQIFSRSPQGGKRRKIDEDIANDFKKRMKEYGLSDFYIHAPYFINFASSNNRIFYGSISSIKEEMEVADILLASGVVFHIGSAKDLGREAAKEKVVNGICKVFEEKDGVYKKFKTPLLLEITAGSGEILGDTFEEMAFFIEEIENKIGKNTLGICFDSAHAFASGYDLRNKESVSKVFSEFDKIIGIDRIRLIHINDSLADFNTHVDRHANIGKGKIGIEGVSSILNLNKLANKDFVLETPMPDNLKDLETLKKIRNLQS